MVKFLISAVVLHTSRWYTFPLPMMKKSKTCSCLNRGTLPLILCFNFIMRSSLPSLLGTTSLIAQWMVLASLWKYWSVQHAYLPWNTSCDTTYGSYIIQPTINMKWTLKKLLDSMLPLWVGSRAISILGQTCLCKWFLITMKILTDNIDQKAGPYPGFPTQQVSLVIIVQQSQGWV